jgi:1A family penicillin-binding protein
MSSRLRKVRKVRDAKTRALLRALALVAGGLLLVVAIGVTALFLFVDKSLQGLPDADKLGAFRIPQPTKIYSADGKLLANLYLENREIVKMSQMSSDLVNAVVAVEDERFYEHNGVDIPGIVRAQVINMMAGGVKEGASTITQQYIRNTILSAEATQVSYTRKLREAYLALEIEKQMSKQEILELYLNAVYFGDGAYGAQAAALNYFGKSADKLTLGEASLLAGLPQSPVALNPFYYADAAKTRQKVVLERMVANGYITQSQSDAAYAETTKLTKVEDPEEGIYDCAYFVAYVRRQLLTQYRNDLVFKGGLKVYTTIDTRLQRYAEAAVRSVLNRPNDPEAGLASVDPRNGYIVAMYGGKNYFANHYNTAVQGKRQPGSAFKTFVLVTALEAGYPPKRPVLASSPAIIPSHPPWKVNNSEGSGKGTMTIAAATAASVNAVFARLIFELGAQEVANTAKRMGITSDVPPYLAIALGGLPRGVSPLEMASAYGTLATGGIHNKPTAITKIVGAENEVIYEHKTVGQEALTPQVSWAATQLLMGVVRGGTGRRAAISGREIAGKTGTAQNYQDTWFCGYTPQLSTAVWMGQIEGSVPMRNVHGQRAFGGTFCAPIWRAFMVKALAGQPSLKFARAKPPHYIWKAEWSKVASEAAAGDKPPVTPPPPPPPPPPADPPVDPPPSDPPTGTP